MAVFKQKLNPLFCEWGSDGALVGFNFKLMQLLGLAKFIINFLSVAQSDTNLILLAAGGTDCPFLLLLGC